MKRALEKIKAALAGRQAAFQNTSNNDTKHTENDAGTQRMRLLEALKKLGSVSTSEARNDLDVSPSPAHIRTARPRLSDRHRNGSE